MAASVIILYTRRFVLINGDLLQTRIFSNGVGFDESSLTWTLQWRLL